MENTSGRGKGATVPAEIDKWNWGAFLLNWIWGIGNNTFIALLMFVPLVGIVMAFVLGAKGSAWAWRNKKWESVEQFTLVQRKWVRWALALYALFIALAVICFLAVFSMIKSSDAYKLAVTKLEASTVVMQIVGQPMSTGIPMGSMQVSGPSGKADLSFSVEGPKGKGTIYLDAVKKLGQWQVSEIVFEEDGSGRRIDLNQ